MYGIEISDIIREMAGKKNKNEIKVKNEIRKTGFYYSFLTLVLILCLILMGYSAIRNISKLVSYKVKINTLNKTLNEAQMRNKELKQGIKTYSATQNLEGIARNNLKMAGEDEVLIIINNQSDKNNKDTNKKTEENDAQ